jgi:hypothetical protein
MRWAGIHTTNISTAAAVQQGLGQGCPSRDAAVKLACSQLACTNEGSCCSYRWACCCPWCSQLCSTTSITGTRVHKIGGFGFKAVDLRSGQLGSNLLLTCEVMRLSAFATAFGVLPLPRFEANLYLAHYPRACKDLNLVTALISVLTCIYQRTGSCSCTAAVPVAEHAGTAPKPSAHLGNGSVQLHWC